MIRSAAALCLALCLALAGSALLAAGSSALTPAVHIVSHGSRATARVALTFDDGASPANCRRILATLVSRGVPATFFPIADAMRADPAFWRLVVAEGDPIGDHTLTHPPLPTLTEARQFEEIDGARRLAESISGAPLLRVLRPPYGAYDAATLSAADRAGFGTILLWDASDRDTSPHGTVAQMLAAAERATDGSVILLHCGPNATPYVIGPLLDHLRAAGLRPVTVPDLLGLRWESRAEASPPTAAQILDGLAPLPPTSSGGVIVGPSGIGTMTFPPGPGSAATPAPTLVPTVSARAEPTPTASPSPSQSGLTERGPAPAAGGQAPAAGSDATLAVGAVAALLAAAIVALGLLARRR